LATARLTALATRLGSIGRRAGGACAAGIFVAMSLVAGCAGHRGPPPSTDIEENGFRGAVRTLAADEFEGRKPGTPGADKTVTYLVDRFRKLGLKPGNGDSYLQQVPMVQILADDASLAVSGGGTTRTLRYAEDMVIWTLRVLPAASVEHSDLVFVGYGIVAPEYHWDDYAQTDVRGKTLLVLVNDPGYGSKDPKVFKGNAETFYGRWNYKLDEAARHGAAGVLLLHDPGAAGYGWNVVVNERTGPLLEAAAADDDAGRAAIEGWISAAAGRALFAQAGLDMNAVLTAAAKPGFKPIAMGLKVDAAVHDTIDRFSSPNVIGVLPGGRHKHEYVIYSAHWDHLGRQSAQAGGALLNGAIDDATGVAGLLMLAQSFVRTRPAPDRSIAFIAFTGGDSGLLGSKYYVEHPLYPLRDTAGVLNLDALHIGGPTRDVMVIGYGNSELEDYFREAAQLQGRELHPDPNPERGGYYQSDQLSFAQSGVPALDAKAGIDDSARGPVWGQARIDDYLAHRYHQPGDQYSADWDVRGTLEDLRLYYEVGNRLARSRHYPRWYPGSEFRGGPPAAEGGPE
jgi:Zn-dependent M28 family amino/carboxypeptidase